MSENQLIKENSLDMQYIEMPEVAQTNFIWGDFIDEKVVDDIIELVHEHAYMFNTREGLTGAGLDTARKSSMDTILPIELNHPAVKNYLDALQEVLVKYVEKFPWCIEYGPFSIIRDIGYQWYAPGGGFKAWHTERAGSDPYCAQRHLVYMTYLNDVPDGGTDWYHQNLYVPAQKGYTVIWPADWTYTHRSHVSETSEKAILTGWYEFE
tara:strand:- start:1244 stop:1870 length:627 start_codon:yes stop_codon:yes gene_type:complete